MRALHFLLILALITALTGCVTTEEAQRRAVAEREAHAACQRDSKTHLALAKCEDALILANSPQNNSNADLALVLLAKREAVADKLDHQQISEADAKLEMATAYSQLTSVANDRSETSSRLALQSAAIEAANRPPRSVNCTSQRVLDTVRTDLPPESSSSWI